MAAVAFIAPRFEQEQPAWVNPERWAVAMDQYVPIPEDGIAANTEDSGISSDDNNQPFAFTSSEEENQISDGVAKDETPKRKRYSYYVERGEGRIISISSSSSPDEPDLDYLTDSETGRLSPPLQEVELTASDEDDDGSVLELVIPMQSRYKRVPTSSPKKSKKKSFKKFLCSLLCCGRGRK